MSSKTISIERSTYERLKAAKRAGESFTDVVDRLLSGKRPRLAELAGLLDRARGERLAKALGDMRSEDIRLQRDVLSGGRRHGRDR